MWDDIVQCSSDRCVCVHDDATSGMSAWMRLVCDIVMGEEWYVVGVMNMWLKDDQNRGLVLL